MIRINNSFCEIYGSKNGNSSSPIVPEDLFNVLTSKKMRSLIYLPILLFLLSPVHSQKTNLLKSGDFQSLEPWTANSQLANHGSVSLLPGEQAVEIFNPVIDIDGALYQDVPTGGHEWFSYSARIKRGERVMRTSLGFIAYDRDGNVLMIRTPTKVGGRGWSEFKGTIRVPENATRIRTLLSVLDGTAYYSSVSLSPSEGPEKPVTAERLTGDNGFSVQEHSLTRPLWELHADDLDGNGTPELIGCDVDGIVTVRNPGSPPFFTWAAPALVYQFSAADLNRDGTKEILVSTVDPKFKIKAINLQGQTVCHLDGPSNHERIAAGDLNGDGFPEIAGSKDNCIRSTGISSGIVLYDHEGNLLWEKDEILREFHIADILPEPGNELVVGGPAMEYRIYNREGVLLGQQKINDVKMDHFAIYDTDHDGKNEIVGTCIDGNSISVICSDGKQIIWQSSTPEIFRSGRMMGTNIATGDFDKTMPGSEMVIAGTHTFMMVDAQGRLLYDFCRDRDGEYWQRWGDRGINPIDIASWNEKDPQLFLSSSRLRHAAYYSLVYGEKDELITYQVPDHDKHLAEIYQTLKQQPALQTGVPLPGKDEAKYGGKVKVFIHLERITDESDETLKEFRKVLDGFETEQIEYLVQYQASDLYGHERGYKLTTDEIVERAARMEKAGIPFGYFVAHCGQVWTSEEAIRRSKQAAPNTFRFLYIAENLETMYLPLYKDVIAWMDKMLDYCAENDMKMIFKEKHDVWGLLPSDPELGDVLFSEKHGRVTVPIWSTNQPYQPEVQFGGMLGLKQAGMVDEFGMSTQYWNWHEWGRFPRGIRDISATFICPSDIILRLDLTGIALGGTWVHVEGGQTYFMSDMREGLAPLTARHRDLAYELIRKNILIPGADPVNMNSTAVIRHYHTEMEKNKEKREMVAYPYYHRNTPELRKGFIPARFLFETYSPDAFPWIAYDMPWNVHTCFPQTPNGWIPFLPPGGETAIQEHSDLLPDAQKIVTDGERVLLNGKWLDSEEAAGTVAAKIRKGAEGIPVEAPGASMIIQQNPAGENVFTIILTDPGYLAPVGLETTLKARGGDIRKVTDLVTGEILESNGNSCPIKVLPGAFRAIMLELDLTGKR